MVFQQNFAIFLGGHRHSQLKCPPPPGILPPTIFAFGTLLHIRYGYLQILLRSTKITKITFYSEWVIAALGLYTIIFYVTGAFGPKVRANYP